MRGKIGSAPTFLQRRRKVIGDRSGRGGVAAGPRGEKSRVTENISLSKIAYGAPQLVRSYPVLVLSRRIHVTVGPPLYKAISPDFAYKSSERSRRERDATRARTLDLLYATLTGDARPTLGLHNKMPDERLYLFLGESIPRHAPLDLTTEFIPA